MTLILLLALLVLPWIAIVGLARVWEPARRALPLRGRLGLTLLFVFTGIGHFMRTEPMALMLPPWVPAREELILVTGVVELAAALGFLAPRVLRPTGIFVVIFLVLVFPANAYSAVEGVGLGAHPWGWRYLLVRAPFQALLIAWTWWFAIRRERTR